jgi:hypothetical protein
LDEATMLENLSSLRWLAETAGDFAGDRPLVLSPVTLRPRIDRSPPRALEPGELPLPIDPRQSTGFAAGWTAGFVAAAAEAGFSAVTVFETVGPKGVIDGEAAYPVFDLLALATARRGGQVLGVRGERPPEVQVLAVSEGRRLAVAVANAGDEPRTVRLEGAAGPRRFELEPGEVARVEVSPR